MSNIPRITVWSIKGGVGKTTIALQLHFALSVSIITNEEHTILENILNDEDLLILNPKQEVPIIGNEYSVIFDFAGGVHRDKRVIDAVHQSKVVLIPTSATISDMKGAIATIKELEDFKNITAKLAIIINQYRNKDEIAEAMEYFNEAKKSKIIPSCEIFKLKYSKVLEKDIYTKRSSIADIRNANPLAKFSYKEVNDDFNQIINFINLNS